MAPGARIWFEREEKRSIKETVENWQRSFQLLGEPDDLGAQKKLCDRYLATLGVGMGAFTYILILFTIPACVGLHLTFTQTDYGPGHDLAMKSCLLIVSALIGLIIPLSIKAMRAQIDWKKCLTLTSEQQSEYKPQNWTTPNNLDLILAVPGFLLFTSIWWGR